ncbi:MAG: phosphoribosylaminoimidazole synthetase [Paenibacillus sp.]|nr:phosphoribosylaminoimidazole synthetase [Paenibacillus sp.]
MTNRFTYENAGVNISNADEAKKEMAARLGDYEDKRILNKPGAFATLLEANFAGIANPVLVLKAEEPGSKQVLSFQYNQIRNICFDLIHHLINDIVVMGARPEAVLDIILCGQMDKQTVVAIVEHLAQACHEQGCSLVGGETSEQPDVLPAGSYMLNASILGVVERELIIDGSRITAGDQIIAIASNGLHTNGYSLVRKLIKEFPQILETDMSGESFLDVILRPHRCYYKPLKHLLPLPGLHGLAHITGGGIEGNLKRIMPPGTKAVVDLSSIEIPDVFKIIQSYGQVPGEDMLRTFNMGVGMAVVAEAATVAPIRKHLAEQGCESSVIGTVVEGEQEIHFTGKLQW